VVGVHLHGDLGPGVTATDLVLHLTRTFREHGVVDKIVEFYGPSVKNLTVGDRATASNMAPEYGATCSYFPIDQQTLKYLADTGRSSEQVARVKAYAQAQSLWADDGATDPVFDELLDINLSRIVPTMSGPRQPHEEQALPDVWNSFCKEYSPVTRTDTPYQDGLIALAAITSCTNTSNPALLIGAGLLARNARKRGLTRKPWVKTSLSPGSKAVSAYLAQAGLQDDLDALGFNVVGYGCMTCIGNSGSLEPDVIEAVEKHGLRAVGVISGNRNFDGRVNPHLAGAYLASPALAVAAAIAGTVRLDFSKDAIGTDKSGNPVTLADLWPPDDEIRSTLTRSLAVGHFTGSYENVWQGSDAWRAMTVAGSAQFAWDPESNYIRRPPYVEPVAADDTAPLQGLRPLLMLADNVTTDHISPAGPVPGNSVAGRYLTSRGVEPADFNVYAARRTNHEVMMRGAFSNPKLINELAAGNNAPLPCYAWNVTHDRLLPAYEAAQSYGNNQKFIILAGRNYGAGSSRDWAAKAPVLLGVRAIVAESYERIHRSNLIGMGIYPLEFSKGTSRRDLCSDGTETIDIEIGELRVGQTALNARIRAADGALRQVTVICRIDSATELIYLKQRGVLRHIVLKTLGTSVN
jgi:aconitate hydratase